MKSADVEEYIAKSNPELRELATMLRAIILNASRDLEEQIKWNMPCYSVDGRNICYFCVTKRHVGLGFYEGIKLSDPSHLLQGEGKQVRQANFTKKRELQKKMIVKWIQEASTR